MKIKHMSVLNIMANGVAYAQCFKHSMHHFLQKADNVKKRCFIKSNYLRIKSLFFYLHDVMKTVGGVKIP